MRGRRTNWVTMRRSAADRTILGQSVVEFALVLPILLTLVGACLDVARVYFGWIDLEAATRDAAQYVATDPGYATTGGYYDPTDTANYCAAYPCTTAPSSDAKVVLEREVGATFSKTSAQTSCSAPKVWAVLASPSTSSLDGGSAAYPMASVTVTTCMPFHTLFAYPWFTQNGDWILRIERTYKVLVGR
jgi:Flp pilus assembly protein TadG